MAESELLRGWFAEGGTAVRYQTAELQHPAFTKPHYLLTGDHKAVRAKLENGTEVTFEPAALQVQLPEKGVKGREAMRVTLGGISRDVLIELERQAVAARAPITLIYREYLDSDLSGPQDVRKFTLRNPVCSSGRITAEASFVDPINIPFPRIHYNTRTHPGLA